MKIHEKYMTRAIQLGWNARSLAAPNPMVGCVIVHKDRIIGEGFTSRYGGPHAEVNAIRSVKNTDLLSEATLYVTLEPCVHFGKTPPCTDLILKHSIPQVVVGITDPNPQVSGKGIQKLKDAGCMVHTGVLEHACRTHHRRFLCAQERHRPYTILKWAQTVDGFLAPEKSQRTGKPEPFWISDPRSRQLVHQWRSEEQAILVGTRTVLDDDPALTTRYGNAPSPLRVILDRTLKIRGDYRVLDGSHKTLIFTEQKDEDRRVEGVAYAFLEKGKDLVGQIGAQLLQHHIQSLIVEGGAQTLQTFIDSGCWDEARIFTGKKSLGKGLKAPEIHGVVSKVESVGDTVLRIIQHD